MIYDGYRNGINWGKIGNVAYLRGSHHLFSGLLGNLEALLDKFILYFV